MPDDIPISLDNFPIDAYFEKLKPSSWQLGGFSNYCYQLPGFPSAGERKKRKRAAFNLWQQALEHISETNEDAKRDVAMRLLKGLGKSIIKINNNINVTGNNNTVTTTNAITEASATGGTGAEESTASAVRVGEEQSTASQGRTESEDSVSLPPPPPYDGVKQPTHVRKRKTPPQREREPSSSSPAPLPKRLRPTITNPSHPKPTSIPQPFPIPEDQSIRQRLFHLRETSLRDIAATQASMLPQLHKTKRLLDGLRQFTLTQLEFIEETMVEVDRLSRRCAEMAKEVDRKVEGLIEDPVLIREDYMLTEKEETDEGEGGSFGFGSSPPGAYGGEGEEEEEEEFGSSPPSALLDGAISIGEFF